MMMARDIARALDAVLMALACGITPDLWQVELLRTLPRRALLLCSRQSGKSTVTALLALFVAIYRAPALVLLVSPSLRQSEELFRTVMNFLNRLEGAPALNAHSASRADLSNGSRILALPGTEATIRGYAAADLIVIDEASRVEDSLLQAVRPMLATTDGQLIALTTPAGKRGWFYEAWTSGDPMWHRVRVAAKDCPRISQAFLDEELRVLGAQRFAEEYNLEFLDPNEAVFPTEIIAAAFSKEVRPLW